MHPRWCARRGSGERGSAPGGWVSAGRITGPGRRLLKQAGDERTIESQRWADGRGPDARRCAGRRVGAAAAGVRATGVRERAGCGGHRGGDVLPGGEQRRGAAGQRAARPVPADDRAKPLPRWLSAAAAAGHRGRTVAGRAGQSGGPAAAAEEDERRRALRAAVEALPEHLREIVVLRLSGELRFEDIAELLQIPLGTALSRMHAAVERLREMLGCLHGH